MLLALIAASAVAISPVSADGAQLRTTAWTVGVATPARASSEVCRWSIERLAGSAAVRVAEGSVAGNCRQARQAIAAAQARARAAS